MALPNPLAWLGGPRLAILIVSAAVILYFVAVNNTALRQTAFVYLGGVGLAAIVLLAIKFVR